LFVYSFIAADRKSGRQSAAGTTNGQRHVDGWRTAAIATTATTAATVPRRYDDGTTPTDARGVI